MIHLPLHPLPVGLTALPSGRASCRPAATPRGADNNALSAKTEREAKLHT
ncbi:hypothetical protein ACFSUS_19160 [Spirosoma soli]|uniref:Uncharacterized protein n=1 Tax=Spirosoma soli TaxID=1770529 RepID=A0ABW5M720_9BACT